MLERENYVTAEKVKNAFLGVGDGQKTVLSLFDEISSEKKLLVGKTLALATYERYCLVRKHISEFLEKDRNLSDIALNEIDYKFICDFDRFMIVTRGCNENSSAKYMHIFKHVIITALKCGLIYKDPFVDFKIKRKSADRSFLTQEEIETLMKHEFKSKRLERARDIFVFCCFSGLSYMDVKSLTKDNICILFDDKKWITGKRGKTEVAFQVPLLEIPEKILEKYKGKSPEGFLLPVSRNRKLNLSLRDICKQCGITKKVTFHVARHTFATLTLTKGVSIESVSKMLGHTNIQTTQIYARISGEKISNDMAVFAEKVEKMGINFLSKAS
jgi:site-specific recombinase XerD